jgi:DUF1680 family protein
MAARSKASVPALLAAALAVAWWLPARGQAPPAGLPRDYPVQPVPFTAVRLDDGFWAPRIEINRAVSVPSAFEHCERTGRVGNFARAAAALRGEAIEDRTPPGYPFDDSDVYKVIEAASYTLGVHPDPALDAYVDRLVATIAAAQEPDGYLYTARTIDPRHPHPWAGSERWALETVDSHELYDLGHLYEAAVAHYQATGKRALLEVALRSADLLTRTFGPGRRSIWPGHQVTEMGLVKLYRVTGRESYLALAKFLLDQRGPDGSPGAGRTYNQSHARLADQVEPVGHAVRAVYMYSGAADVAALTGDTACARASDTIWGRLVASKLYVTGGIGSTGEGEAFGADYELPNMTAYNETCAAVGSCFWNQRLFLLHADARYIDVLERTLYNGLLSGVSLDGKTFFYPNPLESAGQHARSPWFRVACCPGNLTRFLASLPGYVYASAGRAIYVNLFAAGTAEIRLDGGCVVRLRQQTRYPWDGRVRIVVTPEGDGDVAVNVRIPGWARNEPVPSDLYRFLDRAPDAPTVTVNGAAVPLALERGYVAIRRRWRPGDVVDLALPMPVRRVVAHERVEADRGRVAIERGPLVYAAEWPESPAGRVRNLVLPDAAALGAEFRPGLLGGVTVVTGRAFSLTRGPDGRVSKAEQAFTAIPYYAWANRGRGEMLVWIPRVESAARPASASAGTAAGARGTRQ